MRIVDFPEAIILVWSILEAAYHGDEYNDDKAEERQDHHCGHIGFLFDTNLWLLWLELVV